MNNKYCKCLFMLASGIGFVMPAFAQSSVTLFGMMDSGITYVSNQGGHQALKMDDGVNGPNLWGMQGTEDLGGGTQAFFRLVDQFEVDNGGFMPNKSLFSRTSVVGLSNPAVGKLTMGNQYDFMTDALFANNDDPAALSGHFYDFSAGPFQRLALPGNPTGAFDWDRMSGEAVSNSVKYETPTVGGVSAGAMYNFGNVAGSIGTGNGTSFALNYGGRALGLNAAYTNLKYPIAAGPDVSVRNWGVGAHYLVERWVTNVLFTTVRNSLNGGTVYEGSVGAQYNFTPALSVGGSYKYMKGNDVVDNNHAHLLAAIVDYALSKRTTVYILGVYERSSAGGMAQLNGMNTPDSASSGPTQAVVRVGLHTRF